MPHRLATPCRYPGCRELSHARFCGVHERELQRRYDAARGTTTQRGYGVDWQKLRKQILERDPRCQWPGCTKRSAHVDHIVAKRRGGSDDPSNLQGLCHGHHSRKTAREDGRWGGAA